MKRKTGFFLMTLTALALAALLLNSPSASVSAAANTPTPQPTPGPLGPESFPAGVNPLTGLPVSQPENLLNPPALISITNFPVSARPQAGLSATSMVFELYIGEGMTRLLALFYGDYPGAALTSGGNQTAEQQAAQDAAIGPVRSGRLPYESVRKLYNGFLVMASAYKDVAANLSDYTNVFGSDSSSINSAMLPVTRLEEIADANQKKLGGASLSGMKFDAAVPTGGKAANRVWIGYSYLNQIIWRYDPASGAYQRFQDDADGVTFIQASDRLNKEPLAYENVVVLFVNHTVQAKTIIDLDMLYIRRAPALLFRDGKVQEIFWTTASGEYERKTGKLRPIRFVDAQGQPVAFKPGQTWVEIVTPRSEVYETVDSQVYFDLIHKRQAGSGYWAVNFARP